MFDFDFSDNIWNKYYFNACDIAFFKYYLLVPHGDLWSTE